MESLKRYGLFPDPQLRAWRFWHSSQEGLHQQGRGSTGRASCAGKRAILQSHELVATGRSRPEKHNSLATHLKKRQKISHFVFVFVPARAIFLSNRHIHHCSFGWKGSGFGTQLSLRHQRRIFEPKVQIPCELKLCYQYVCSRSLCNPAPKPMAL